MTFERLFEGFSIFVKKFSLKYTKNIEFGIIEKERVMNNDKQRKIYSNI